MPEDIKDYYFILSKKLLSIDRVKSHVSYNYDEYALGRKPLAKFGIDDKTLKLIITIKNDYFLPKQVILLKTKKDLIMAYNILDEIISKETLSKK